MQSIAIREALVKFVIAHPLQPIHRHMDGGEMITVLTRFPLLIKSIKLIHNKNKGPSGHI